MSPAGWAMSWVMPWSPGWRRRDAGGPAAAAGVFEAPDSRMPRAGGPRLCRAAAPEWDEAAYAAPLRAG